MSIISTHARGRTAPGIERTACGQIIHKRIPVTDNHGGVTCRRCARSLQRVARVNA